MNTMATKDTCLYCNFTANGATADDREFHNVFDEIGIDLQLPILVEKYFHISVQKPKYQKMCDQCLNHLIELFDLDEHGKSQNAELTKSKLAETQTLQEGKKINKTINVSTEIDQYILNNEIEPGTVITKEIDHQEGFNNEIETGAVIISKILPLVDDGNDNNRENLIVIKKFKSNIDEIDNTVEHNEASYSQSFDDENFVIEELEENSDDFELISNSEDNDQSQNEEELCFEIIDENELLTTTQTKFTTNNLIMEGYCSQDYDLVDINSYLDSVLTTKFETLDLQWTNKCILCSCMYNTLNELLKHSCVTKQIDENNFKCLLQDCNVECINIESLGRHLVIRHYKALDSLHVYGSCPECQWTFSNFPLYNKHSCCRHLKRKAGVMNFCKYCKLEFPSLKRYFFHMQFHLNKYRPKVCLICEMSFNNSNDFFEHVQYSHEPENALACKKCDRFFKDKNLYESHVKKHNSNGGYHCAHCNQRYKHRHNLIHHLEVYHNRRAKRFRCEFCKKVFMGRKNYLKHLPFHSQETEVHSYICSQCGLVSGNIEDLNNHIDSTATCSEASIKEQILSVVYFCENCGIEFDTVEHLCKHRLSPEHNDLLFRCVLCEKFFNEFRCVRSHMKTHKNYLSWLETFPVCRLYVCNMGECRDTYPVWTSLYYHKKRPHVKGAKNKDNVNEFVCQFCKKECPTKMSLAVHVARSHNTKNIKCSHCNNSYKDEKALQGHIDYMHVPIKCDQCFKVIKNRRNFETHERVVHKRTQRYFCSHCSKGFYHKSEMENHVKNIHTDVVYTCSQCFFTTNYENSLKIHVAKHNNELAYQCKSCPKSFTRKHVLQMHMRRRHRSKELICNDYIESGCEEAFVTRRDLKRHIEREHCHIPIRELKGRNIRKKSKNLKTSVTLIEENVNEQQEECMLIEEMSNESLDYDINDEADGKNIGITIEYLDDHAEYK